jgi:hypothetical protein
LRNPSEWSANNLGSGTLKVLLAGAWRRVFLDTMRTIAPNTALLECSVYLVKFNTELTKTTAFVSATALQATFKYGHSCFRLNFN